MANKTSNTLTVQVPTHFYGHDGTGLHVRTPLSTLAVTGASTDAVNAVRKVTSTTDALSTADNNKMITCANAATITMSLPANMPEAFSCSLAQIAAGVVKFTVGSGGDLRNADGHNGTRTQYSAVSLTVIANVGGNAAQWLLSGDTATVA